jgi:hypothetical protein
VGAAVVVPLPEAAVLDPLLDAAVVEVVAALPVAALSTAPPRAPPTTIEPSMAEARTALRVTFMPSSSIAGLCVSLLEGQDQHRADGCVRAQGALGAGAELATSGQEAVS